MGHMIAFGIIAIIGGVTQMVGAEPGREGFGVGLAISGAIAIAWAVIVLIVRLIP